MRWSFDGQFRPLSLGFKKAKNALEPTISEVINHVNKEHKHTHKKLNKDNLRVAVVDIARTESQV